MTRAALNVCFLLIRLIGNTKFVTQLFIFVGMSDYVERGRRGRP